MVSFLALLDFFMFRKHQQAVGALLAVVLVAFLFVLLHRAVQCGIVASVIDDDEPATGADYLAEAVHLTPAFCFDFFKSVHQSLVCALLNQRDDQHDYKRYRHKDKLYHHSSCSFAYSKKI